MARLTPVVGESVCEHVLPGQIPPASAAKRSPVERIGGVRVIRGGEWSGVSLRLADGATTQNLLSGDLMELSLVTLDGRSIRIAKVEEDEAVAVWRAASAASGLPMMLETPDGLLQAPFPQIGRLALGPIRIRRAHAAMRRRRPRFLMRRKPARLAERPHYVSGAVLGDHNR
jgi:hypothetical protein